MHHTWLVGLFVSALMLSLLSGCGGQSGGGGDRSEGGASGRLSEENLQELDGVIDQQMRDKDLPGVVVGV